MQFVNKVDTGKIAKRLVNVKTAQLVIPFMAAAPAHLDSSERSVKKVGVAFVAHKAFDHDAVHYFYSMSHWLLRLRML